MNIKEFIKQVISEESEYQTFFRKALEKTGKSIPEMSEEEKKAFFNKIDAAWSSKGEKNEGNAFGAAVTKAKKEGDNEFTVDGETYPVKESMNENLNWDVINNVFVKFLKVNTKTLENFVKEKNEEKTKAGIKAIISGLTNAQKSLKLEVVHNDSIDEADMEGEWVAFIDTDRGKKLMGTFKSGRAANMWVKKNVQLLDNSKTNAIGAMVKTNWDRDEAKYAIENINEVNNADLTFLIDQLVNSMEFYDEREFVDHIGKETGIDKNILRKIFKGYWKLSPTKTMQWSTNDWKKWLANYGI
jgi:hypothetical protein